MTNRLKYLFIFLAAAIVMWIEMFVLKHQNFWIEMMIASGLLAVLSFIINKKEGNNKRLFYFEPHHIFIGILTAVLLYILFFAGDWVSKLIFNFADKQVTGIYGNKSLLDAKIIGLLLFFFIGPAEEIFWRGFVQDTLQEKFGDNKGWIIASLVYAGVHIFAMNFMLFMAALICGLFWGYIFKKYKSLWPGIISHAIWDLVIFVIFPVR